MSAVGWSKWLALAALLVGAAVACGDEGPPNPAPFGDGAGADGGGTVFEPPPKREQKRTVEMRNPMGGPPGNLLVDGDFEFSITFEGTSEQTGWISTGGYLRGETGGLCRSGLRCGVMKAGDALFGKGTSADGVGMAASVWVKPPLGSGCNVIDPVLIRCNFNGFTTDMPPDGDAPDEDGWCRYSVRTLPVDTALCMYIDNTMGSGETALVDSAVVMPVDGTVPLEGKMRKVFGLKRQRIQALADFVRSRRQFGRLPEMPNPRQ